MKKNSFQQKGIGMVEIIVCLTIIAIAFWGFLELARYHLKIHYQTEAKLGAMNLAVEALEAVRSIRDENWDNLASFSLGIRYYPITSGNNWTLTDTNPGPLRGIYDRWVVLERVYRDASDNISPLGIEDLETKKVTAIVEWNDHGQIKQFNLTTYLTNWPN